jgi:predicted nuclease of restriction endonuclease-like (RecB) superfamily
MYMGEGLSRMMGNCQVRFFGGRDAATYALLPDNFDFLTLAEEAQERDLERGLVDHIRDFLLELGMGFSFLGSQYPLVVSG